jgi:hypothetical protein
MDKGVQWPLPLAGLCFSGWVRWGKESRGLAPLDEGF